MLLSTRIAIGTMAFAAILSPQAALSECTEGVIYTLTHNIPENLNVNSINLLFDGSSSHTGNTDLEFEPNTPGQNALIVGMGQSFLAGTTLTFYFENDDADGKDAQQYADNLNGAGFGAWYWDWNGNGLLEGNDFDINGDGTVDVGTGDYSPLGFLIVFYRGEPGDPVGSGPGVPVYRALTPISAIEAISHTFVAVVPAEFDHFVVESTASGSEKPRINEIELNGTSNGGGFITVLHPICAMHCDCS